MKKAVPWLILFAVIICASAFKLHLLGMPLERDEGEYAYIAQLLLGGTPLYHAAFSAKLPAIYFTYACFMALFGQTPFGIHLGLLVVNALSTAFLFLLSKRLLGVYSAIAASATFATLMLGKYTLAFNVEHLVVLLVLAGSYLLLRSIGYARGFFTSGLLFGLAFTAKQHAAFFVLFGALYLVWASRQAFHERMRRAVLFIAGAAAPFTVLCVLFRAQGVFGDFWFWTVTYAYRYCAVMTLSDGIRSFMYVAAKVLGCASLVWISAAAGLVVMRWSGLGRQKTVFLLALSAASLLAIVPGLYFRHHYFILLFPACAMCVGILARRQVAALAAILVVVLGISLFQERQFLFRMDPAQACREIYARSPIMESVAVADYLRTHMAKDSRVIVLGSEPQIYFYLKRRAPVSYIYMYPLVENTPFAVGFQQNFKKEVESANAEYLVAVHIGTSWFNWYVNKELAGPMFAWIEAYRARYYEVVGVADMVSRGETVYRWDADAASYAPRSDNYILVLKRRQA